MTLNAKVDATLKTILDDVNNNDHSNIEDFDPITYINEIFPNEQSLSSIDRVD